MVTGRPDSVGHVATRQPGTEISGQETMLYIATVHYKTPKWIDIQQGYLRRNIVEPYELFGSLELIPSSYAPNFDTVINAQGAHEGKLNLIAAEITAIANPNDIILFLDGDAFPIADPMPTIYTGLESSALVAVRRDENRGDKQPHPCFCAIRVRDWERLHGDWSPGYPWKDDVGKETTDVGGNLLGALERSGLTWTPLLRTNYRNDHPLWFGVYGDIVYHHGAGFRRPHSRWDESERPKNLRGATRPVVGKLVRRVNEHRQERWLMDLHHHWEQMGDQWFRRLEQDPDFYLDLIQPP